MAISWRKLGAFVADTQAVDENQLRKFKECGGQWVVPVTYGDSSTGPTNIEKLPQFKKKCQDAGLYCGIWFNGWGGDIGEMCAPVAAKAKELSLQPVVADLEGEWFKNANAHRFPEVLKELRRLMPHRPIMASTTGFPDRAMIWNGRTLTPPQSLEDLKIKWGPQWYYLLDGKFAADWSMKDLKDNGKTDFNIADPTAYGGRGIRMYNTHGTLYVTGIENHSLATGIAQVRAAKAHGFSMGFSIYVLERTIDSDFALLAAEKGRLFV